MGDEPDRDLLALDKLAIRVANEVERAAKINGKDGGASLQAAYALAHVLQAKLHEEIESHVAGGKDGVEQGVLMQLVSFGIISHQKGEWSDACSLGEECPVEAIAGNLRKVVSLPEGQALEATLLSLMHRILGRLEGQENAPVEVIVARAYGDRPPREASTKRPVSVSEFEPVFGLWLGHHALCHDESCEFEVAGGERAWPELRQALFYGAEAYALERAVEKLCLVLRGETTEKSSEA